MKIINNYIKIFFTLLFCMSVHGKTKFTDRQVAQALEAVDAVRKRNESEVKVFQLQVAAAELDAEEEEERLEEEKRALEADREDIAKICHEEAVNLELELQNTIEVTAKLEQIADETEDESKREIYLQDANKIAEKHRMTRLQSMKRIADLQEKIKLDALKLEEEQEKHERN